MKTMDFSETIAACDLKVGRCRKTIGVLMKVCDYLRSMSFLAHLSQRLILGELIGYP